MYMHIMHVLKSSWLFETNAGGSKGDMGSNITVGDFNTSLLPEKLNRQLSSSMDQVELTDTCRTVNPQTAECAFLFPSVPGTFSRIGHTLDYKASLNRLKKN